MGCAEADAEIDQSNVFFSLVLDMVQQPSPTSVTHLLSVWRLILRVRRPAWSAVRRTLPCTGHDRVCR